MRVERGEVFGYLGPNGAGKSTTIRLLLDLIHPSAGRASILGLDTVQHVADRVGILRAGRLVDVDAVERLRERAVRHVTIVFADALPDLARFSGIDRLRVESADGRTIRRIGVVAYTALLASIFPSFKGSADLQKLVERYPDALEQLFGIAHGSIGTGRGYMDAELFSLMLPLLVLVLAIGSGARAFAGEEDAGRLELLLAYPLRRRDAVLAKGVALAGEVGAFSAVAFASLAVLSPLVGLDLPIGRLAAALGSLAALGERLGASS